jgi:Domain of unknown function (DUF4349)
VAEATSMADILALESEIARREAELESLEARQRTLDSVDLSTVTLTLTVQAATAVTLTIVGGLLLFTVLVLLVGVPLWVMLRRRASARQMPATPDG